MQMPRLSGPSEPHRHCDPGLETGAARRFGAGFVYAYDKPSAVRLGSGTAIMKTIWIILTALLVLLTLCLLLWLGRSPEEEGGSTGGATGVPPAAKPVLRIGLIPERDIFEQRRRYQALADYLSGKLHRDVELATENTYEGILDDLANGNVDAAFLGSLVATLAMDRHGASPILKPEMEGGITTYRGVIFVRSDSPIQEVDDLAGHSIAMVRTTTAGDLFPVFEMIRHNLFDSPAPPQIKWVGTHDAAIREVWEGRADVGAAKDLRLDAYEAAHPERTFRRLTVSDSAPNNALLIGAAVIKELGPELRSVMSAMSDDPAGREVLKTFGAIRFVPCDAHEYEAVFRMIEDLGENWDLLKVPGPPPVRHYGPA
jgi:phosphonate transport system substrate-binding protein